MVYIAQYGLLIFLFLFVGLHLGILFKIIPYRAVWGGRLKSDAQMYRFEILSVLINLLFICLVLVRANYVEVAIPKKIIAYSLWCMAALFLLNTLGNAISKNKLEKSLFTPVTLLLAVFSIILAVMN